MVRSEWSLGKLIPDLATEKLGLVADRLLRFTVGRTLMLTLLELPLLRPYLEPSALDLSPALEPSSGLRLLLDGSPPPPPLREALLRREVSPPLPKAHTSTSPSMTMCSSETMSPSEMSCALLKGEGGAKRDQSWSSCMVFLKSALPALPSHAPIHPASATCSSHCQNSPPSPRSWLHTCTSGMNMSALQAAMTASMNLGLQALKR